MKYKYKWKRERRGQEDRFSYYKGSRLRLTRGFRKYYVWSGSRAIAEGTTIKETEEALADFLAEVEAGHKIL